MERNRTTVKRRHARDVSKMTRQAKNVEIKCKRNQTKASMAVKTWDLTTKKQIIRGMA